MLRRGSRNLIFQQRAIFPFSKLIFNYNGNYRQFCSSTRDSSQNKPIKEKIKEKIKFTEADDDDLAFFESINKKLIKPSKIEENLSKKSINIPKSKVKEDGIIDKIISISKEVDKEEKGKSNEEFDDFEEDIERELNKHAPKEEKINAGNFTETEEEKFVNYNRTPMKKSGKVIGKKKEKKTIDEILEMNEGEMGELTPSAEGKKETNVNAKKKLKQSMKFSQNANEQAIRDWEVHEESAIAKTKKRQELRMNRVVLTTGTVTVPQNIRDRVGHLIRKVKLKLSNKEVRVLPGDLNQSTELSIHQIKDNQLAHPNEDRVLPNAAEMKRLLMKPHMTVNKTIEPVDCIKFIQSNFNTLSFDRAESMYYIQQFMSSQYAITYQIFSELERLDPSFVPQLVLDFGSGSGTTLFAADDVWGQNIVKQVMAIEPSTAMLDFSQVLNKNDNRVVYRRYLSLGREIADYDLVVSAGTFLNLRTLRERR